MRFPGKQERRVFLGIKKRDLCQVLLKDEVKLGLKISMTLGNRIGTADRKSIWEG